MSQGYIFKKEVLIAKILCCFSRKLPQKKICEKQSCCKNYIDCDRQHIVWQQLCCLRRRRPWSKDLLQQGQIQSLERQSWWRHNQRCHIPTMFSMITPQHINHRTFLFSTNKVRKTIWHHNQFWVHNLLNWEMTRSTIFQMLVTLFSILAFKH